MTRFVEYTTKPGDRWDLIAYRAYGDAARYAEIIDANRDLFATDPLTPIPRVLPVGLTLRVPLLDAPVVVVPPPWRTA